MKKYEFTLERHNGGVRLTGYKDEDRNFKSTTPTSEQDYAVVKNLKGLLKKLNLDELHIKIEIK